LLKSDLAQRRKDAKKRAKKSLLWIGRGDGRVEWLPESARPSP
jgi:hypothetical protein